MRESVLAELVRHLGSYISGEELAERLGISRTAVWKHVNTLKEEGYMIETQRKRGYCLQEQEDKLNPIQIKNQINTKEIGHNIIYLNSVDSTNNYAKKIAETSPHGTIVLSDEQTGGRGRLGRGWSTPKGKSISMSIILKPQIAPSEGAKLTQIAAAAVCKGIMAQTGLVPQIKWPNDIVIAGKKVCGILTEMVGELSAVTYLIVGIGINVNVNSFDEEVGKVATSLFLEGRHPVERTTLIASVLQIFEQLCLSWLRTNSLEETLKICREASALLGKEVRIVRGNQISLGTALEITDEGQLKVRLENGKEEILFSGEVSVRGRDGYV